MKTRKQLESLFGGEYCWEVLLLYYTGCMRIYQHSSGPQEMLGWYCAPRKWNPVLWVLMAIMFTLELCLRVYDAVRDHIIDWRDSDVLAADRLRDVRYGDGKLFGYKEV